MPAAYVYILTNNHNTTLYVGVTSRLFERIEKHRHNFYPNSFTARYNLKKLVYFERHESIELAIAREKQLKAGSRKKKVKLINSTNPEWKDIFERIVTGQDG